MFKKHVRERGKISISRYFANFSVGDKVLLDAEPSLQKNLYHQRFHGKQGVVSAKRGSCYTVTVKDGGKQKLLIVHPIHLRKVE